MGQSVGKRSLVTKHVSVYDTSVWARKYRHDFEALKLTEHQVRLMWDEYCKVSLGERKEDTEYLPRCDLREDDVRLIWRATRCLTKLK